MWTVKTESEFAAAHFLSHYHGKCERLHGHNYRVVVWARGSTLDDGGMLVDFARLKTALRQITTELDHSNLNDLKVFSGDPSAERIAEYVFHKMETALASFSIDTSLLYAVDVYETPSNMSRYEK